MIKKQLQKFYSKASQHPTLIISVKLPERFFNNLCSVKAAMPRTNFQRDYYRKLSIVYS